MEARTFDNDNNLPSLPLPTLEHTLQRYLDSVRAVVDENEYARSQKLVEHFAKNVGRELHEQLEANIKRKQERNWLSRWWDEEIYLKWRSPIAPAINMMGFDCLIQPQSDSQLARTAIHMCASAIVFESIREERYPAAFAGKHPMTMYQFKHFFNTCRIPHRQCDELISCFRTISEDVQCPPTHVVVIRNGHFFTFDLYVDENGSKRFLVPLEIIKRLEYIIQQSDFCAGLGLGALTALPRDEWADIRDHLCQIDEQNRSNLKTIEQALLVYALDNDNVENFTELTRLGMLGNVDSRWFDRSIIFIFTRNGLLVSNMDHSAYEGLIPLQINERIQDQIDSLQSRKSWPTFADLSAQDTVREIDFIIDSRVVDAITRARTLFYQTANDIDILVTSVSQCTKEDIKQSVRIHPDTFFQLCLQLAYFKSHGQRPAPTYETASTRRFYRGRTETVRTCSPEVVAWCRVMNDNKITETERRKLFLIAASRHQELMIEASANQGCDRHMFGLSMIARETGRPFEIDLDSAWIKSGGNGNFILSTSCLGFGSLVGATAPMCHNGYGVFYRLGKDATSFIVTAHRSSRDTDIGTFSDAIARTLIEMKTLFLASNL